MSWIENLRSADWNQASGLCVIAYLLGCFTVGYYLVRWFGDRDIRDLGSGSVGARNVGRVFGKPGFVLTALLDFGKGALAVWVARQFTTDDRLLALAMLAVVAGHIWPVQLRFRGGKGMATTMGALSLYNFPLALTVALLCACGVIVFRRTVLPALFAVACLPLASLWLGHSPARVVLVSALAGLVWIGHRRNVIEEIMRLAARRGLHPGSDESQL